MIICFIVCKFRNGLCTLLIPLISLDECPGLSLMVRMAEDCVAERILSQKSLNSFYLNTETFSAKNQFEIYA